MLLTTTHSVHLSSGSQPLQETMPPKIDFYSSDCFKNYYFSHDWLAAPRLRVGNHCSVLDNVLPAASMLSWTSQVLVEKPHS